MQFTNSLFAAAALFSLVAANTIEFVNMDSKTRNIVFTPEAGLAAIGPVVIPGLSATNVDFPESWSGNWYTYNEGAANVPGMLGEVTWNAYAGSSYFDVSAIVNPTDYEGVKMIFPKNRDVPLSGCLSFPCKNAYNKPNDLATLSTDDDTLVCLIGNPLHERRRSLARLPIDSVEA